MSAMGDIDEIQRVKYRYLRALDTKHWDEFADTLTEDVVGDYGSSLGKEHHFTDRDSLVEFMRDAMPANSSPSTGSPIPRSTSTATRRRASGTCKTASSSRSSTSCSSAPAFYHDRYRRTADGWRISATGYARTYDATLSTHSITNFKVKAGQALNI